MPGTLISGNIKFMRIFAGFPVGGVNDSGVVQNGILVLSVAVSAELSEIRATLLYSDI